MLDTARTAAPGSLRPPKEQRDDRVGETRAALPGVHGQDYGVGKSRVSSGKRAPPLSCGNFQRFALSRSLP